MGLIFRSGNPVVDEATLRLTAAVHAGNDCTIRTPITCPFCDAAGSDGNIVLPDGQRVGSLAIHMVALHRELIPAEELTEMLALPYGEEDPEEQELFGL